MKHFFCPHRGAKTAILFCSTLLVTLIAVSNPAYAVTIQLPPENFGNLVQYDVPNCGAVACGPTAAVNSFVFLENQYPSLYDHTLIPDLNANGRRDYSELVSTAATLSGSQYMDTTLPFGTFSFNFSSGQQAWIESQAPGQSTYATQGSPTISFLTNELTNASASNLMIGYYDSQGNRMGGHFITLTGLSWTDVSLDNIIQRSEGATISFVDPGTGTNRTTLLYQNEANGILQMAYSSDTRIELDFSIRPILGAAAPEPPTWLIVGWGLILMGWRLRYIKERAP